MSSSFEKIREFNGVVEYKMKSNGLVVLACQDDFAPVVGVQITYRVGSRHEATGYTGATHLLEHLMFKGSENFNKAKGNNIDQFENVGAMLNATTWMDRTNYYTILPNQYLADIIALEADRCRNAFIDEADRQSEMTVVRNEFEQGENEPFCALYKHMWATAYQAHPYHHDTIGWRSDIEKMSIDHLKWFYNQFYWPNNATLTVVGDFKTDDLLSHIESSFGVISRSEHEIPTVYTEEPPQEGERRFVLRRPDPGQTGLIAMAWKAPSGLEDDHVTLQVLGNILASGKSSRLHQALVNSGKSLGLSVDDHPFHDPGLFGLYVTLVPGVDHAECERIIREEIEKIKQEGVRAEEIDRVRRKAKVRMAFMQDRISSRLSSINEAIAAGDWTYEMTLLDRYNKVTTDMIVEAANAFLVDDRCTIGYFIPKEV